MAIAYNQQTGEALYSDGADWKPAKIAMNPKTGERVAFDGKAWQPLQSKPLPAKIDDDRPGEIPGVPRLSEIVKGGYEGLKDAFMAPGKVLSGEIKPGTPEAESAARNVASTVAGGMGGSGIKAAAKEIPEAVAFRRMGVNPEILKKIKTPDDMQSAIKSGVDKTKGDVASSPGVAPKTSDRELTEQVAQGIGDKRDQVKALENARWEKAKEVGAAIPAGGVSNIEDLRRMVGQIGKELKGTGGELASDLRSQKLEGDSEILDLRDKIHELEEANVAGEDMSELGKAKMELKAKRLETARQQLAQKLKIADNLDQRIAEADKAEKAVDTGSLPTKIETAADLIQLKQHLNSVNSANLSAVELTRLRDSKAAVDAALAELKNAKPDVSLLANSKLPLQDLSKINFGETLAKANRRSEINAERYGGDAAKQLGVDKAFIAAEKKTGRPLVGKDATTNAIAGTEGIVDRIQSTAHVDWLKANMRPQAFNQLMANKLAKTLDEVGTDAGKLRENRELLDYIVKDGVGMKSKAIQQKLDDLQNVLDKLAPDQAGVSLKMAPKKYRGKDPAIDRALNAAKAAASTVASGGKPTTYGIAKAADAVSGGGTAEAKRLMALRKELRPKNPVNVPGAAIGAYIGGNADGQQ